MKGFDGCGMDVHVGVDLNIGVDVEECAILTEDRWPMQSKKIYYNSKGSWGWDNGVYVTVSVGMGLGVAAGVLIHMDRWVIEPRRYFAIMKGVMGVGMGVYVGVSMVGVGEGVVNADRSPGQSNKTYVITMKGKDGCEHGRRNSRRYCFGPRRGLGGNWRHVTSET